jgi:NADPH:quinone reductase-like Zn-dependent oxidoreductase
MSLTKWGGNARFLAVKPEELVKVPDNVDPAEAACLTETYLSAFQVLHLGQSASMRYLSGALKGKSFLLVGNVQPNFGRAIGQLALIGGADCVYATARSKHAQKLCTFGILPVSNDPLDWCARLAGKIDVVIVLSETLSPLHYKVLAESGQVIVMAHANGDFCLETDRSESKAALLVCTRNKSLSRWQSHNYDVYLEWDRNLKRCKADLQHLVRLLQERSVLPYVLDRIPLTKVPRAHEMIELKKLPGFIVCEPWLVSKSRAVAL